MKWIFSILSSLIVICIVTACVSPPPQSIPTPTPIVEAPLENDPTDPLLMNDTIEPIQASPSISGVVGWYDKKTILYVKEEEGKSVVLKHHINTGKESTFFEGEGIVTDVSSNNENDLFVIQVMSEEDEVNLFIVDQDGNTQMNIEDFGEDYTVYWNPNKQGQFIMIAFLPNWEYEVFLVDVQSGEIAQMDLEQTYFQWLTNEKLAYLKWPKEEPGYYAPFYEFDLRTEEEKKIQDDVITYMSFANQRSLTVTVDSIYDLNSIYTFYEDQNPISTIEIPILNTYSEQWWVPFHTYDEIEDTFYYLQPKYSGDFFSYEDGYELMAYQIHADSNELITVIQDHEPLRISPGGEYLLIGNQFEKVFDLTKKELVPILD